MDYLEQSFGFKLRKALRYAGMYGPRRTVVKIRGQYHMKRRFGVIPKPNSRLGPRHTVAVVGCGNYAYSNICHFVTKQFGHVIGGCMDVGIHRAASLAAAYRIPYFTSEFKDLLELEQLSVFYIASNHASHAEYAIAALDRGRHVYIEKPHVVSEDQLERLVGAMRRNPERRVWLGFNRPGSRFGVLIKKYLDREEGPAMYNWFVAGHAIDPDHWYFKPEEGGRVLGNLCHWTDFILRQAGESHYPILVRPTRAFKSDADIVVTYTFAEGTMAVISFSAKGHTFEGVKEQFNAHKGNCLLSMSDYRVLTVDVAEKKHRHVNLFRDHGHEKNITGAYRESANNTAYDSKRQCAYVWNTAMLFLKTREALETNREILIEPFREEDTRLMANQASGAVSGESDKPANVVF